jgi:hypothetical protein
MSSEVGLGNAVLTTLNNIDSDFILFSGEDLAFGFSDLRKIVDRSLYFTEDVIFGEKTIEEFSHFYSLYRMLFFKSAKSIYKLFLGLNDPNGSIFMKTSTWNSIVSKCKEQGFGIGVEICKIAISKNLKINRVEVFPSHWLTFEKIFWTFFIY